LPSISFAKALINPFSKKKYSSQTLPSFNKKLFFFISLGANLLAISSAAFGETRFEFLKNCTSFGCSFSI
jgi:hypothetical protein